MIKIYGIKNCDTVKKALNWLDKNNVEYHFHDYKKSGVDEETLLKFSEKFGWEKVANQKSRTWRGLDKKPQNQSEAIVLMKEQTSLIKRPIIYSDSIQLLGFDAEEYKKLAKK